MVYRVLCGKESQRCASEARALLEELRAFLGISRP